MITFSDFKLEGTVKIKTATKEKYPNKAVITKLAIVEGQRSASIHFNTKAQELLGVEIPTQVVIIKHEDTFLISPFDKVKEVNPDLAMAFESKKVVYRLGMNGKVSSKVIYASLSQSEYELVVENAEESIFKLIPLAVELSAAVSAPVYETKIEEPTFFPDGSLYEEVEVGNDEEHLEF